MVGWRAPRSPDIALPNRQQLIDALATLERVGRVAAAGVDARTTVDEIVRVVAEQMGTPLCSLYLTEPGSRGVVLAASTALRFNPHAPPRLGPGEGLVGLVVEKGQAVAVAEAERHPRFKFLPKTGEERFVSFLGVPVVQGGEVAGCLVVQTEQARTFEEQEIQLLQTVAHQVGGLVEGLNSTALIAASGGSERRELRLVGVAAAPGVAVGRAVVERGLLPLHAYQASGEPEVELVRLDVAVAAARGDLDRVIARLREAVGEEEAALLEMQRLLLTKGSFLNAIEARITAGANAYRTIREVALDHYHTFLRLPDPYIRQRGGDVLEVARRLLETLCKGQPEPAAETTTGTIRVANQISVTDVLDAPEQGVRGVVQGATTPDSHAVLLARTLGLPMVTGIEVGAIRRGDRLIVDGTTGTLYLNPSPAVAAAHRPPVSTTWSPNVPATALPVRLRANVSVGRDLELAAAHGAMGIGLYRTEYAMLTHRDALYAEEEQLALYRAAVERFPDYPTTLRTLDLGGDKPFLRLLPVQEANPLLGLRAVRLTLHRKQVLITQLRAMLRAAAFGPVRILFPMVTTLEELDALLAEVAAARAALVAEGVDHGPVEVGVMVEVPVVARAGGPLFERVDFVAIGSNDLTQYALAVDRQSATVGHLYQPLHPAVLLLIQDTVAAAHAAGKQVCLCGELAAWPLALPALLALAIDELSLAPPAIPRIWDALVDLTRAACAPLLPDLLAAASQDAVIQILEHHFPHLASHGADEG